MVINLIEFGFEVSNVGNKRKSNEKKEINFITFAPGFIECIMTLSQARELLTQELLQIDFEQLPISDYNKQYIRKLKPALPYYMHIYALCIRRGLKETVSESPDLAQLSLVDFGGGSGFLSLLAAKAGFGEVIYVDLNPRSVETIRVLKEVLGFGPTAILHGSSDTLAAWCREKKKKPSLLIATDLIEHVYDLPVFFRELAEVNGRMSMLFTTASTPFNPFVRRRLQRWMDACETGSMEQPNYWTLRYDFIRQLCPNASEEEVGRWASLTRGLVFEDIRKVLDSGDFPPLPGKHNTCDPRSGNWMERILPLSAYRNLAEGIGYGLNVEKGFYNIDRKRKPVSFLCRLLNLFIRRSGKAGFLLAPFMVLIFKAKRM